MTPAEALQVADMGENALWLWIKAASPLTQWIYDSPAHAREVALDVLAERVRELERLSRTLSCSCCREHGCDSDGCRCAPVRVPLQI